MSTELLTRYRPVSVLTPLAAAPLVVAAPAAAAGQAAADVLAGYLRRYNSSIAVSADPPARILEESAGPVFVLGNLADSQCVRQLYYQFRCATDRWYPGPGGYEVRVLLDPYGTGHNLVHLGYSDEAGLDAGLAELLRHLHDPLPYLSRIKATRLPLSPAEENLIRTERLPEAAWRAYNTYLVDQKGYLGYLTGDQELLREYASAWPGMIACGVKRTPLIAPHLYMTSRVLVWWLLEQAGAIPAELRLPIARFFLDWAESPEGQAHLQIPQYQSPYYPRQNHGLLPALALNYLADFFGRYFPELSGPAAWRETVRGVYAPYTTSWKPICDGLCHGWWLSQPVMLDYGLCDPAHAYFAAGGARQAAECAMAVVNNEGWMPSAGDSDQKRQFPGPSLRIAAAYYGEPRYMAMHNRAPVERRFKWFGATPPPRAFDTGLPTADLADGRLTVVPMDPLVHGAWEKEPRIARGAADTPPQAPIEACFDKIALRAGWRPGDDYLLIDGLGGGSHSYADAGTILEYTRLGVSAIVSEDSLIWTAPEDHSGVSVTRDGEMGAVSAFAELQAQEERADGSCYLRLRLPDFSGADWVREVHFIPGAGLVCHDTVIAKTAGEFAIEANFRTPAAVEGAGRVLTCPRRSPLGGEAEVRMESLVAGGLKTERVPVELRLEHPSDVPDATIGPDDWRSRYATDSVALTIVRSRLAGQMNCGDTVSLTHFIQVRRLDEPALTLSRAGNGLRLAGGGQEWLLSCHLMGADTLRPVSEEVAVDARRRLEPVWQESSLVTCLKAAPGGQVACGTASGTIALLTGQGELVWRHQLSGEIYDIGFAGQQGALVVAGHAPAMLTAFAAGGALQWQQTIPREPSPYPWWELPHPAPVQVAGGGDDSGWIMVGCGDMQVRCYEIDGALRWLWRYNEGVPGRMLAGDVDGDGTTEVLVGGEILSDTSCCRIITPACQVKAQLIVEGWTSLLTAVDWAEAAGSRLVACGGSRGCNLRLYDVSDMATGNVKSLIEARYGGKVTAVSLLPEQEALIVGTSQGFLRCLDYTGACRWQRLLPQGVTWVGRHGAEIVVHERQGRTSFLRTDGSAVRTIDYGQTWRSALICGDVLWFIAGESLYREAL